MIKLLYFARLRESLGCAEETLDTTPGTVSDLLDLLSERDEHWQEALAGQVLVAVNQEMAKASDALNDGDEVGLFPPVTGG